jgi:hypothetical protein
VKNLICLLALLSFIPAQRAIAFGTVNLLGQNAEHERITRHALGCRLQGGPDANACFKDKALQDLAGRTGTWGAVGAPDNPTNGRTSDPKSHCDDGDFLAVSNYPQSAQQAQVALQSCRNWMIINIDKAVDDASALVQNHRLVDKEIPTVFNCTFNYTRGRAYCNVLEDFGAALHASQDFYSHSNWVDQPNPSLPISITNPPGLAQSAPSSWLNLRNPSPAFPQGLMTGCFKGRLPDGVSECPNRVTHFVLNKDKGVIDPAIGIGSTQRSIANPGNFSRAISAAIEDTRDKWSFLQEKLIAKYGVRDGGLMICALVNGPDYKSSCR